jgi:rRNA maturation RNase YbeY
MPLFYSDPKLEELEELDDYEAKSSDITQNHVSVYPSWLNEQWFETQWTQGIVFFEQTLDSNYLSLKQMLQTIEITLIIMREDEARELNKQHRGKNKATNILTFPYDKKDNNNTPWADIIICWDVVTQEAIEQNKSLEHHLTHLWWHGLLLSLIHI